MRELERLRDDNLVALLQALRARRYAAGERPARRTRSRLFEAAPRHSRRRRSDAAASAPRDDCRRPLVDRLQRPHDRVPLPPGVRRRDGRLPPIRRRRRRVPAHGASAYTVESHIRHLHEVAALEPLDVETQVLGADEKRLRLFHTLTHARSGETLATGEHLLLHVDTARGRVTPWLEPVAGQRRGGSAGPCGAAGARWEQVARSP